LQKTTALGQQFLRFFRWQNRLKKDLIDKVFAFRRDWWAGRTVAAGGIYLPGEQFLEDGLFPCLPFLIMEE
jgi:hypothetical protein